ncbi:hypothetical protein DIE06_20750 [Burkholderia sp. Bp8998]|nr:hypothetical protein DIE06_20750 [Burkholderia sp. Bp8998]
MSLWMALPYTGGCGAHATCCSRVVPEAGAPMSQTRHAFDRCRHRWRKPEGRARKTAGRRESGRSERAAGGPVDRHEGPALPVGHADRFRLTRPDSRGRSRRRPLPRRSRRRRACAC